MNEIFNELIDEKKSKVNELQKQLINSSKSIIDNRLILESVYHFLDLPKITFKSDKR